VQPAALTHARPWGPAFWAAASRAQLLWRAKHSFLSVTCAGWAAGSADDGVMKVESVLAEDTIPAKCAVALDFGGRVGVTPGEAGLRNAATVVSVRYRAMAPRMFRG